MTSLDNQLWTGKEKGWAWVICVAAFFCTAISDGIAFGFASISTALLQHVFFTCDYPIVMTMFCGSLLVACYLIVAPIASSHFSQTIDKWRKYTIVGSCMTFSGFVGSAMIYTYQIQPITQSLDLLETNNEFTDFRMKRNVTVNHHAKMQLAFIGCFSILGGVGLGIMYIIPVTSLGTYFEKRRPFAVNLSLTGSCLGTMVIPLSTAALQFSMQLEIQDVLILLGACALHGCVFGMLLRPTFQEGKRRVYKFRKKNWVDRVKELSGRKRYESEVSIGGTSAQREVVAAARAKRLRQYSEVENLSIFPSRVQSRSNSRRSLRTSESSDVQQPPRVSLTKGSAGNLRKEAVRNAYREREQLSTTTSNGSGSDEYISHQADDTLSITSRASDRLLNTDVNEFELICQLAADGEETPGGSETPDTGPHTPVEINGKVLLAARPPLPRSVAVGTPPMMRGRYGGPRFVRNKGRSLSESVDGHRSLDKGSPATHLLLPPGAPLSRSQATSRRRRFTEGCDSQRPKENGNSLRSSRTSVHSISSSRLKREKSARALIIATAPHMVPIPQTRRPKRLLRPVHKKQKKKSIISEMRTSLCADRSLLYTNPAYIIFLVGHVVGLFAMFIPFFFLPIITAAQLKGGARLMGSDYTSAAIHAMMQVLIIGCCSTFGRWLVFFLGEMNEAQPDPLHMTTTSFIFNAGSTLGLYVYTRGYTSDDGSVSPMVYVYSAVFGFCLSFFTSNMPLILNDIVGKRCQNSAIAHCMLWGALGVALGPPVAGFFVEEDIWRTNAAVPPDKVVEGYGLCNYIRSAVNHQEVEKGVPGIISFHICLMPLTTALLVTAVALAVSSICFILLNFPCVQKSFSKHAEGGFAKDSVRVQRVSS